MTVPTVHSTSDETGPIWPWPKILRNPELETLIVALLVIASE